MTGATLCAGLGVITIGYLRKSKGACVVGGVLSILGVALLAFKTYHMAVVTGSI